MSASFLTELPSRWKTVPLKHACSLNPEVLPESTPEDTEMRYIDISALEAGDADLAPRELTFGNAPSRARRVLRDGDTLISTVRTYLRAVAHFAAVPDNLVASTGFAVLRPNGRLVPRFAYWAALSAPVIESVVAHSEGVSYPAINPSVLGAIQMPVPPLAEQERIANFLDEKTARIDALIAEKESLYAKLSELETAEVSAAILGTHLPGPRTPTGVEELGSIPSNWKLTPMMRLTEPGRPIMYGIVLPGPNVEEGPGVPIVKGGDVRPHRLRRELLNRTTPEIEAPFARARLAPNDIVYSIRGSIGDAELVPEELRGANITQDVARISPRNGVYCRWLLYVAKSLPFFSQLEKLSLGAAVKGINIWDLKRAKVPTPPYPEQEFIAHKLDTLLQRVSGLKKHCEEHVTRLREYRASLIAAAVAGRLSRLATRETS